MSRKSHVWHAFSVVGRGKRWTWSLAMHGSAEFWDVTKFNLAAKVESAQICGVH